MAWLKQHSSLAWYTQNSNYQTLHSEIQAETLIEHVTTKVQILMTIVHSRRQV